MSRVLLLATTTGYQTRMFGEAAARLGVELVYVTDRCHVLDDPWGDQAVPVRFYDQAGALAAIADEARRRPVDSLLVVGDRPTVVAARVAAALGLPWHPVEGALASNNKAATRRRLAAAGLPTPWFREIPIGIGAGLLAREIAYPCVIKPLALAGSRGVMRADTPGELAGAVERLTRLLHGQDVRALRDPASEAMIVEGFIEGREYAVEAVLEHGTLQVLAVFDKPDPLDGPFFEETIYVTPPSLPPVIESAIRDAVAGAVAALGLRHGPIHAECRVNGQGVYVLEVAARPIGGLCSRALRFGTPDSGPERLFTLEELLLRHALGEPVGRYPREPQASGVMMVPIPQRGYFKGIDGLEEARQVPGVEDIRITAKPDQLLLPLPEGASYLGFIFARGNAAPAVDAALREAHGRLKFRIEKPVPVARAMLG